MNVRWAVPVLFLVARVSTATEADAGSPGETSLADELSAAAGQPAPTPSQPTPATSAVPHVLAPVVRSFQSMNPDISAIIDATGGAGARAPLRLAGDDPDLQGGPADHHAGATVQEAEVGLQAVVDPYFRADMFLTIPNLEGIEVEEAYITTLALPFNLQLKVGEFRSALGRQNGQHLHLQDFTRRPLINAAYLGTDGLRSPGAQLSYLFPLPFFLQLFVEAFSVANPNDPTQFYTFGGGSRLDLTYTAELKFFVSATDSLSVYGGLNFADGRSPGIPNPSASGPLAPLWPDSPTQLYGADVYMKYKPPNVTQSYFSLAWQTEYWLRVTDIPPTLIIPSGVVDGGIYTQLVAQIARRWYLGARLDVLGLPASFIQPEVVRASASLTFATSEFARIRLYGEWEHSSSPQAPWTNPPVALVPQDNLVAYLQLEISMGVHGAHPF